MSETNLMAALENAGFVHTSYQLLKKNEPYRHLYSLRQRDPKKSHADLKRELNQVKGLEYELRKGHAEYAPETKKVYLFRRSFK